MAQLLSNALTWKVGTRIVLYVYSNYRNPVIVMGSTSVSMPGEDFELAFVVRFGTNNKSILPARMHF